jgi:SAM-dependent methyltransferase
MHAPAGDPFLEWVADSERRHLSERTFPELRRAVQAISSWYVECRRPARALDTPGKRAAFALFYGTLHFLSVRRILATLGVAGCRPTSILDLGCGTGVAGAAWALAAPGSRVRGVDRSAWAVAEARHTYRCLRVEGRAGRGELSRWALPAAGGRVVAAWALDEVDPLALAGLLPRLLDAAAAGAEVLIVEPVARSACPWWDEWAAACEPAGGRAAIWREAVELPPIVAELDRAAGLDHRELVARYLFLGRRPTIDACPGSSTATTSSAPEPASATTRGAGAWPGSSTASRGAKASRSSSSSTGGGRTDPPSEETSAGPGPATRRTT